MVPAVRSASRFTAVSRTDNNCQFFLPAQPSRQKILRIVNCLTLGRRKICDLLFRQAQRDVEGMQMRAWMGIAIVVAIGLIWSVAAMSKLVPLDGSEMRSAAIAPHAE